MAKPLSRDECLTALKFMKNEMAFCEQGDSIYLASVRFLACCLMIKGEMELVDAISEATYFFEGALAECAVPKGSTMVDCQRLLLAVAEEGARLTRE